MSCAIECETGYLCHVPYSVTLAMDVFRVPYCMRLAMDVSCDV